MKKQKRDDILKRMTAADRLSYNLSMDATPTRKAVNRDITNMSYKKNYKRKSGPQKRK